MAKSSFVKAGAISAFEVTIGALIASPLERDHDDVRLSRLAACT
jgi:hypothetical protein